MGVVFAVEKRFAYASKEGVVKEVGAEEDENEGVSC